MHFISTHSTLIATLTGLETRRGSRQSSLTLHHGLYRFARMQFVLRNAPGTFQQTMEVTLSPVRWQFSLVYLSDIIIFSQNAD